MRGIPIVEQFEVRSHFYLPSALPTALTQPAISWCMASVASNLKPSASATDEQKFFCVLQKLNERILAMCLC